MQTKAIKSTSQHVQDSKDAKSNDTSLPAKPASKQYRWGESTEASRKIEGLEGPGGRGLREQEHKIEQTDSRRLKINRTGLNSTH